jgi:hypothetical protein
MADYTFPTSYGVGTATVSNGSVTVIGQGTYWMSDDPKLSPLRAGDLFGTHVGIAVRIDEVVSNTELTLAHEWPGASQTAAPYEIQLTPRIVGAQEATRRLLVSLANGNVEAFAALAGGSDLIPIFSGSGTMTTVAKRELVNGVQYDVQVDELADRAAFDGQEEGYAVLVANVGDGRSALYTKRSNTSADWSDPSYITGATGETGPYTDLIFAPVQTLAPGEDVTQTTDTSVPGQVTVTFGIPAGVPGDMAGPDGGVVDGDYVVFDGSSGKLVRKGEPPETAGKNDTLFALEIADLKGSRLGMIGGVADAFDDETGVDASISSGYQYNAASDYYSPLKPASVTNTVSGTGDGASVFTIFNRSFTLANGATVRSVGVHDNTARSHTVKIGRRVSAGVYDVVAEFTFAHPGGGWSDYILPVPFVLPSTGSLVLGAVQPVATALSRTPAADRAYKLGNISGTGQTGFTEDNASVSPPVRLDYLAADMILRSVQYPAASQPSNGRLSLQVQGSEVFSINTELVGELSRDNGTTWTAAALSLTNSFSGVRIFEADDIDLSAQPVGSFIRWRIRTFNSKDIAVSGVVAQWKD